MIGPAQHRWSGWPGAWCLDCGAKDPAEQALADDLIDFVDDPASPDGMRMVIAPEVQAKIDAANVCPEPGSHRFDPYSPAAPAPSKGDQ